MNHQPVIGIICCAKDIEGQPGQAVHNKYIDSVTAQGGLPILLPSALNETQDYHHVFSLLDGVLLTGSYSNVAPSRYGASHHEPKTDLSRDTLSFALLEHCMAHSKPLFGVCRGMQELNVYFGGTLYPDFRSNTAFTSSHSESDRVGQGHPYDDIHSIDINPDGHLAGFGQKSFRVNSLHNQAVRDLAPPLRIEAIADDGLIEAISHREHPFMLGVQWHPEYRSIHNPLSVYLFRKLIQHAQTRAQPHD